ncbi:MAG: response regulator [Ruminococcaceae bacterium]|nr:response regulator [Oscillospiraceae bacterium]
MHRIIIAMASDDLGHILESKLNTEHSVVRCFDGITALDLLRHLRPDALLLDLSLPLLNGLDVLKQATDCIPPIVMAITDYTGPSLQETAKDCGIRHLYMLPVEIARILEQLRQELVAMIPGCKSVDTYTRQIEDILLRLGFKANLVGYQQLLIAIPLVLKDSSIPVCKELYPEIAKRTGIPKSSPVEHTIRSAIRDAWTNGDPEAWKHYFPTPSRRKNPYPSNKQFINTIAKRLRIG